MSTAEASNVAAFTLDVGTLALDRACDRVGVVMDHVGTRTQLRPLRGGLEWDAYSEDLSPAITSDLLRPAVREANARSTGAKW